MPYENIPSTVQTKSFTPITVYPNNKIRAMDINDNLSFISIDTLRINNENNRIIDWIFSSVGDSSDKLKSLNNRLDAIERRIQGSEGKTNTNSSRDISDFIKLDGIEKSSSGKLELKVTGFANHINNTNVKNITAKLYPTDEPLPISVDDITGNKKHRYWKQVISVDKVENFQLGTYSYRGVAVDINIRFNSILPINYVYLTPIGRYETGVEVFINGESLIDEMVGDNFEWIAHDNNDVKYCDEITIRLSQENGTSGLVYESSSDLMEVLNTLLLDDEPDTNKLRSFVKYSENAINKLIYTVGLYSFRAGLRRYATSGTAKTDKVNLGVPIRSAPSISPDNISIILPNNNSGTQDSSVELSRNIVLGNVNNRDSNLVVSNNNVYPIVKIGEYEFDGYITNVSNAFIKIEENSNTETVEIGKIDSITDMIPYDISYVPTCTIHNGKLVFNFDVTKYKSECSIKYYSRTAYFKLNMQGDGYTTPSVGSYYIGI
jgi:hypothetical protein